MRLKVGATGWVEAPAGGALGFPPGRLAGIPPPPQGEAWVSPAAAAGRPAGPCAPGSAHPAPACHSVDQASVVGTQLLPAKCQERHGAVGPACLSQGKS